MAPRRRQGRSQERREESAAAAARPSVAAEVRQRQRAVAEREASRLARPEARPRATLGHADRRKSAVSSTPSGVFHLPAASTQQESQEWCGPFSVARQLIAKREQLKRQQEEEEASEAMRHPLDTVMEELEMEKKRKAHPSMQWKGNASTITDSNNESLYAKRQKRVQVLQKGLNSGIPPLFDMCVQFLVDNFEHVESLGNIDSSIHTAIANQLVAAGKLHGNEIIQTLLADPTMEALDLVDCSGITVDELARGLSSLPQLRYLRLHQCGRCFHGPAIVNVLASREISHKLLALSIGGAHLLKDADAAQIVSTCAPSALEFMACPQLSLQLATSLRDTYSKSSSSSSNNKLLELCLEDVPALKEEHFELLLSSTKEGCPLKHLQSLSLRRVTGLTDSIVTRLLSQCGSTLQGLDVSENPQLTDAVLSAVRQYCSGRSASLHALAVSALPQLTSHGLEALFLVVEGQAPPPQLRTLDLSQLDRGAVTDVVLEGALLASNGGGRGSSHCGLVHLNVQGAACLTDAALEQMVASCRSTLETVNLSFCCGLTDGGFGYLVDSCGQQLRQVQLWGNAQLTDNFYDGHARVNDATLALVGVWMKQSTSRTVR